MDALIELSWKCSLVLVLGGVAAICARRASAATRHLIWAAALAGALALPAASVLLPRIRVAALPARAPLSAPVVAHRVWKSVEPVSKGADVDAAPGRPVLPAPPPLASEPTIDWAGMARLLWATVALALLLRVAAGDLQLRAVARRAQRVIDREWLDLLEGTCARLGLRRDVELLESDETEVPLTWGTLRPRLLLPAGSSSWPDAQKRAVLAHELAHVERHDALTQLIARVACAVHWFNPLAWAAAAALRRERERACDDRALQDGSRPSEYAASLLEVARAAFSPGRAGFALAMARRSQLEGRLLAVLDPRLDRRPVNGRRAAAAACAAGFLVLPLATVRAERVQVAAAPLPAPASIAPSTSAPPPLPAQRKRRLVAQATPPSPPSPPAPPAPPDVSGSRRTSSSTRVHADGGSTTQTSSWSDDGRSVTLTTHGKVEWNDDASDIAAISPGGSFELSVSDGARHWHAEVFPAAGGMTRTLLVDGVPRPWDPSWFAHALEELDRHSGFAADLRFPRIYQRGGARAVIDYARGVDGDYGKRRYLTLLVEADPMREPTAVQVLQASEKFSGDYDRAELLKAVAAKARLDSEAMRAAFLHATGGIHGDYERGRVLHELTSQPRLSPELTRGVLAVAAGISGDYEKAGVLVALAENHPVEARAYLEAAATLSGDYERGRALKALITAQQLDGPGQVELIRQAARMGDYESSQVLTSLARRAKLSPEARKEYEKAAQRLGDYERQRALAALGR